MGHTYIKLLTHIVFSTKHRQPFMDSELKPRLFAYMGGIIREIDGTAILINGPSDHVHILASLPAKAALSDVMRILKTNSSKWVHDTFRNRRKSSWQTGYGAFSVSQSDLEVVKRYIADRQERHRRITFQEEYLSLLKEYGIEYDEQHLWD